MAFPRIHDGREHLSKNRALRQGKRARYSSRFYAVATHPKKLAMPVAAAQADVPSLQHWQPVAPCADLFRAAWGVQDRHGFSWRDSAIVAAAILANCKILLSEDLQHEQIVNNALQIIDPFAPNAPAPGASVAWTSEAPSGDSTFPARRAARFTALGRRFACPGDAGAVQKFQMPRLRFRLPCRFFL
jgi:hypothetical protein